MSADNFYIIRKHPNGGFVALMGFESSDEEPSVEASLRYFPHSSTVERAVAWANTQHSEYGVRVHPECYEDLPTAVAPGDDGIGRSSFEIELTQLLNRHSKENASGTPDFILAGYLMDSLMAYETAVGKRADWRGESVELPSLMSVTMPPEEVARHHDYPTSDPGRPMDEVINRSLGRITKVSVDETGFHMTAILDDEHHALWKDRLSEHDRRREAGL